MFADIRGQGPRTFLFIHGFGGGSALWTEQIEYFEEFGRVMAIDLPGHGKTPWQKEALGVMAGQVAGLLKQSGIRQDVVLVANSFGGLVALELWRREPGLLKSLTLAGSMPRFTAIPDFSAGLDTARIRKLSTQFAGDPLAVMDMFYRSLFTPQERSAPAYARVKQLRCNVPVPSKEVLDAYLDILEGTDLREVLAGVKVPVQFVVGDQDYICPLAVVEPMKKILPKIRVDIMPVCGHFPFLSYSSDFNGLLQDFVS